MDNILMPQKIVELNYRLKILTLICFVLSINESKAQLVYTSKLDSIVINVGRQTVRYETQPFAISFIDSNNINQSGNKLSLSEVTESIPGVIVNNRYNLAQGDRIIIRGIGSRAQFGIRGIKILLDGIPLTFPDGQSQLNNLNISSLKSIQIIRGASSSLYGNSAGGVISLNSKQNKNNLLSVSPEFYYGSFGTYKFDITANSKIPNGYAMINTYALKSDGYRGHSEAKYFGGNLLVSQSLPSNFEIRGLINYYYSPFLFNPSSLNKDDAYSNPQKAREFIIRKGAGKKVSQLQGGFSLDYPFSQSATFSATFYSIKRKLFNAIPNRIIELDKISYGFRSTFLYIPSIFKNKLSILSGIDYEFQDDDRTEFVNEGLDDLTTSPKKVFDQLNYGEKIFSQTEKVSGIGYFTQFTFSAAKSLNFISGIRYDNYAFRAESESGIDVGEKSMNRFNPSIGSSFKVSDQFIFFSNYSTSFQTPTTTELSNNPDGVGGFNLNLQPEKINSFEIGIRGSSKKLNSNYEIVGYKMLAVDKLIPYQNKFEEVYYKNSGETIASGIEILLYIMPIQNLTANLAYSYQDIEFKDFIIEQGDKRFQLKGNKVPGIPEQSLYAGLGYNISPNLYVKLRMTSQSRVYTNDFNGPPSEGHSKLNDYISDGFILFHFQIIYNYSLAFSELELKIGIDNIFDERYIASIVPNAFNRNFFEPGPGRTLYLGAKLFFNK